MAGAGFQSTPNAKEDPNWSADGHGNAIYDNIYEGENAYDKSVDEYRRRGNPLNPDGTRKVEALTLNQGQADESRGLEMSALGMLRRQGQGTAPSSAQILSDRANQGAVQNAGQQVTAARGIGNRIAASQNAGTQAGTAMLAGNAANANMRAGEISQGQGAYSGGAGAVNTQDIGAATTNAQLEAQQRKLEELHQQANERLGYDTRRTQMSAQAESIRQANAKREAQRAYDAAKATDAWNKGMAIVSTATSLGSSASSMGKAADGPQTPDRSDAQRDIDTSDPKAKMHIGSLSSLYRSRGR